MIILSNNTFQYRLSHKWFSIKVLISIEKYPYDIDNLIKFITSFSRASEIDINDLINSPERNTIPEMIEYNGNILNLINSIFTNFIKLRFGFNTISDCRCKYLPQGFQIRLLELIKSVLAVMENQQEQSFVSIIIGDLLPNFQTQYFVFLSNLREQCSGYKIIRIECANSNYNPQLNNVLGLAIKYNGSDDNTIWVTDFLDNHTKKEYMSLIDIFVKYISTDEIKPNLPTLYELNKLHTVVHEFSHKLLQTEDVGVDPYSFNACKNKDDSVKIRNAQNFAYVTGLLYLYSCVVINRNSKEAFIKGYNELMNRPF